MQSQLKYKQAMFLNTNFQLSNEILFWQLCEKGQLHEIEAFLENYNTISKKTLSFGLLICYEKNSDANNLFSLLNLVVLFRVQL